MYLYIFTGLLLSEQIVTNHFSCFLIGFCLYLVRVSFWRYVCIDPKAWAMNIYANWNFIRVCIFDLPCKNSRYMICLVEILWQPKRFSFQKHYYKTLLPTLKLNQCCNIFMPAWNLWMCFFTPPLWENGLPQISHL